MALHLVWQYPEMFSREQWPATAFANAVMKWASPQPARLADRSYNASEGLKVRSC